MDDSIKKLLMFTPEDMEEIRKKVNISNKEDREKAIEILADWVKQQEHFTKKEYSKDYYERCLVTCKGSIELAKKQIDKMCTFRTMMPEYFGSANVLKSDIVPLIELGHFGILPKLTKNHYRVIIMKFRSDGEIMSNSSRLFFHALVFIAEFLKHNDYHMGAILVVDAQNASVSELLLKFNVFEVARSNPIISEGYGARIKGVVFITSSKLIEGFVGLIKPLLSHKIASRFHVLTSRVRLAEFLEPAEILPEEYGGKEKPLDILQKDILDYASSTEHVELMAEMNNARTDESKRSTDSINHYMGVPGTFRNMTLD